MVQDIHGQVHLPCLLPKKNGKRMFALRKEKPKEKKKIGSWKEQNQGRRFVGFARNLRKRRSEAGRNLIKDEGLLGLREIFENESRKPEGTQKNHG